jgi:hypothetical protein
MPQPLASKSAISQLNPEQKMQEILYSWLSEYFDGDTHTIGDDPELVDLVFPACDIAFTTADLTQGLAQPHILATFQNLTPRIKGGAISGKRLVWAEFGTTYYVRTPRENDQHLVQENLCRQVAGLLLTLHHSSPRARLVEKGLIYTEPQRGPVYRATDQFHTRLLTVQFTAEWEFASTG